MNFKHIALCLSLLIAGTPAARAEDAQTSPPVSTARFSDHGRALVAGSLSGHWSSQPSSSKNWSVDLGPSLGYFVRDRLAVGLSPGYRTGFGAGESSGPTSRFHELSLAAYALYDLSLAERVSLLLIPSLGYAYRHQNQRSAPFDLAPLVGNNLTTYSIAPDSRQSVRLSLHAPLVYHVSSSVVLGLGPYFSFERLVGSVAYRTETVGPPGAQGFGSSPFSPQRNHYEVGLSSFIGASF